MPEQKKYAQEQVHALIYITLQTNVFLLPMAMFIMIPKISTKFAETITLFGKIQKMKTGNL